MIATLLAAPAPPGDPMTTYVIMGGATIIIIYLMLRMTKKKKTADPFQTPFQTRGLAQHRSVERQMENLLVELSEMSRQISAQLDTRSTKLELIIKDADERIARLEALNRQGPPRPDFTMPPEPRTPAGPLVSPDPIAAARADDVSPSPSIDPAHAEVYRRADEGANAHDIAQELGRPSGEIELILALRPR